MKTRCSTIDKWLHAELALGENILSFATLEVAPERFMRMR